MSLILDALRRSEQADLPLPYGPVEVNQAAGGLRLRPMMAALLLGALLGAGVVMWFIAMSPDDLASSIPSDASLQPMGRGMADRPATDGQRKPFNQSSADQGAGSQTASLQQSDSLKPAPSPVSSPSRLVEAVPTEAERAVAELNAQMWSDSASADIEGLDEAAGGRADGAASEPVDTRVSSADSAPGGIADPGSIAPPIDLEKAIAEAARVIGESALVPHAATTIDNLSQQQKDGIPTLIYSRHDFQAEGSATVELNGRRLSVGGRAGQVTVKEILVDSVILDSNGVVFRLTALNSWVNM